MKVQVIIFLFFFFVKNTFGFYVRVYDEVSGEPIESVNVFNFEKGLTTDANGICDLGSFSNDDLIIFSMIGYTPLEIKKVDISENIYLERETLSTKMIHVVSFKKVKKRKYNLLESDLRVVLPYAKKTALLIKKYEPELQKIDQYSGFKKYIEKKRVFEKIENDIIKTYGYKIRKLKKRQGRLLIRLIDRETNITSFEIIKKFRNIFSASFWQLTARVFGHNLKTSYNPEIGDDRFIEYFIKKIEKN